MKDKYKSLQGTIKLWSFTKWGNCDIICANETSIYSADVIAVVDKNKTAFIFTTGKSTDFIKKQIINCRDTYNKLYLVTNFINTTSIPELEINIGLINIADKYAFGKIIEEL